MSEQPNTFITSDIGIAAYLQLKKFKLVECRRLDTGKFHFKFEDPENKCPMLSLEFID